jgi:hypothetical protein
MPLVCRLLGLRGGKKRVSRPGTLARSRSTIIRRISANGFFATSAIWNLTKRAQAHDLAPISIGFSTSLVSDDRQGRLENNLENYLAKRTYREHNAGQISECGRFERGRHERKYGGWSPSDGSTPVAGSCGDGRISGPEPRWFRPMTRSCGGPMGAWMAAGDCHRWTAPAAGRRTRRRARREPSGKTIWIPA